MRKFVYAGWLALVLAALSGSVVAVAADDETWYAARITAGDKPLRVEHFWSKGSQVRMETVIRAQPFITLVNGEYYTVIDPVLNRAMAIRRPAAALKLDRQHGGRRPFARDADRLIEAGAEQVGEEKIGGRTGLHYRASNRLAASEAWVTEDEHRLPLRVIRYDRASGETRREDFVDWARKLQLPEDFFQPAAHIEVERLEYEEFNARVRDRTSALVPILIEELLHGRE